MYLNYFLKILLAWIEFLLGKKFLCLLKGFISLGVESEAPEVRSQNKYKSEGYFWFQVTENSTQICIKNRGRVLLLVPKNQEDLASDKASSSNDFTKDPDFVFPLCFPLSLASSSSSGGYLFISSLSPGFPSPSMAYIGSCVQLWTNHCSQEAGTCWLA